MSKINLKDAIKFHGHLGPYLVLGLLMGGLAINKLKCKKHFGLKVFIKGATERPKSCLIDGLQLSTGCTYGKGNIEKIKAKAIEALFVSLDGNKKINISLKKDLVKKLSGLKGHSDSEAFAKKLLNVDVLKLFEIEA